MRDEFLNWLEDSGYRLTVARSRVSNCNTVCRYEGDLDEHFDRDRCESLLDRLQYSRDDERDNVPKRHNIPIDGNIYNGTATLRAAVRLYVQFRSNAQIVVNNPVVAGQNERTSWPQWRQPSDDESYEFAKVLTRYVKFLSPDIVQRIVEDNNLIGDDIVQKLEIAGVNPSLYLWERCSCSFPGVRRHAGSSEISAFRHQEYSGEFENAVKLDDNSYPKQLWAFVFTGRKFGNFGPDGYSLAHLIDHKKERNRMQQEFNFTNGVAFDPQNPYYGLYSCPTNAVYVPSALMRPTDFNDKMRNLLVQKAFNLYGDVCNLLPEGIALKEPTEERWKFDNFDWGDPVGTTANIDKFLDYRREELENILG